MIITPVKVIRNRMWGRWEYSLVDANGVDLDVRFGSGYTADDIAELINKTKEDTDKEQAR